MYIRHHATTNSPFTTTMLPYTFLEHPDAKIKWNPPLCTMQDCEDILKKATKLKSQSSGCFAIEYIRKCFENNTNGIRNQMSWSDMFYLFHDQMDTDEDTIYQALWQSQEKFQWSDAISPSSDDLERIHTGQTSHCQSQDMEIVIAYWKRKQPSDNSCDETSCDETSCATFSLGRFFEIRLRLYDGGGSLQQIYAVLKGPKITQTIQGQCVTHDEFLSGSMRFHENKLIAVLMQTSNGQKKLRYSPSLSTSSEPSSRIAPKDHFDTSWDSNILGIWDFLLDRINFGGLWSDGTTDACVENDISLIIRIADEIQQRSKQVFKHVQEMSDNPADSSSGENTCISLADWIQHYYFRFSYNDIRSLLWRSSNADSAKPDEQTESCILLNTILGKTDAEGDSGQELTTITARPITTTALQRRNQQLFKTQHCNDIAKANIGEKYMLQMILTEVDISLKSLGV